MTATMGDFLCFFLISQADAGPKAKTIKHPHAFSWISELASSLHPFVQLGLNRCFIPAVPLLHRQVAAGWGRHLPRSSPENHWATRRTARHKSCCDLHPRPLPHRSRGWLCRSRPCYPPELTDSKGIYSPSNRFKRHLFKVKHGN